MKRTVDKAQRRADPALTDLLAGHAAVRPGLDHGLPRTAAVNGDGLGREFSRIPLNSAESAFSHGGRVQSCPFPPQRCPFGGACHTCPPRVQAKQGVGIQRKATNNNEFTEVPPIVHEVLRSPGQPLDAKTRAVMESRFRSDFSRVRVHTDARAAESARAVNALAYTVGHDVVFSAGRYAPRQHDGQRLIAHELAHTVQQRTASSSLQSKLNVDRVDSPHEGEADRAAESVLLGKSVPPIGVASAILSREVAESSSVETRAECRGRLDTDVTHIRIPTADAPTGRYTITSVERVSDNERRVRISSGQRYLVRRNPWTTTDEVSSTRGRVRPGIDREQVWVELEFCRGSTQGTIRVGANVPEQVIQLLLRTVSSGGDVAAAWRQASITPSASGTLRVGHWQVDLSARATVGSSGQATGAGGEASVSTETPHGRVTGGVSVESQQVGEDPFGGARAQLFFRVQWGGSQPAPRCTTQRVRSGFTYECREERDVAPRSRAGTQSVTTTDEHVYNVFFRYAVPDFDERRNRQTWRDLSTDLASGTGFQVTRIEGWASPEGPTPPGPGFMGNEELSKRRAEAARTQIETLCGTGNCFAPGAQVVGMGERLDLRDESGQPQDASGRPLEEHVTQTFPTDPREASVRTPALMERLRRTRSLHARAEIIYPQLRRAIVTLRRSNTRIDPCRYTIPGYTEEAYLPSCPAPIRRAAFPDTSSSR